MSKIPSCRTDENYNEKYLPEHAADFVTGFDWAVQCGMNSTFANFDEVCALFDAEDIDPNIKEQLDEQLTADNILTVLANRPDLQAVISKALNIWCEMERDELITSMLEELSDEQYNGLKAKADAGYKNAVVEQQERIGVPEIVENNKLKHIKLIGEKVRTLAEQQGLPPEQIAYHLGCTMEQVKAFYSGEVFPMYKHLVILADLLNTSVADLLPTGVNSSVDVHRNS